MEGLRWARRVSRSPATLCEKRIVRSAALLLRLVQIVRDRATSVFVPPPVRRRFVRTAVRCCEESKKQLNISAVIPNAGIHLARGELAVRREGLAFRTAEDLFVIRHIIEPDDLRSVFARLLSCEMDQEGTILISLGRRLVSPPVLFCRVLWWAKGRTGNVPGPPAGPLAMLWASPSSLRSLSSRFSVADKDRFQCCSAKLSCTEHTLLACSVLLVIHLLVPRQAG